MFRGLRRESDVSSYPITEPLALTTASEDVARIGSSLTATPSAAVPATTPVLAVPAPTVNRATTAAAARAPLAVAAAFGAA